MTEQLPGRRDVLKAGGLVLCAGALAACSSPPLPTVPAETSSTTAASTSASDTVAPTTGSSAGTTSAAGGTPVSEVPVGGAKFYPATSTIVTQPEAGVLKAFDMTCPHEQNPVRAVDGGQLLCTFHKSRFDLSTGARLDGPAPRGLTPKQITVTGDTFTVA